MENSSRSSLTKTLVRNIILKNEHCEECDEPLGRFYYFIELGDEIWHVCKKCGDQK